MKKNISLWSAFIFLVCDLFIFAAMESQAQTINNQQTISDDHKLAIEKIIQKINKIQFIQGDFSQQKKLQGMTYALKSQGHFMFWKGQGLHLATDKPFFNAITITTTGLIDWQPDGTGHLAQEQAAIIQREINKTLLAFFSADIGLIEQRFSAEWQFDHANWQLTLTPKLEMIQKNMRVAVIRGQNYMNSLSVTAGNGDQTDLAFSAQQESAQPSALQCVWFFWPKENHCKTFQ